MYLVLKDGLIGKLNSVCRCEKCLERGSPELEIVNLDGDYLDYVKMNSITENDILYFGKSAQDAVNTYIEYIQNNQKGSKFLEELVGFVSTLE